MALGWAGSRASTDTHKYQAVMVPGVLTLRTTIIMEDAPRKYPGLLWWVCDHEQKQMGFVWGGFFLLTGTNVFCKLFCISTVFSFCIQANFIHWKTTRRVSLHGY